VLHAHLEWGVALAVGVELAPSRHARAERALRRLAASPPDGGPRAAACANAGSAPTAGGGEVRFVQGDLLGADLGGATVAWCAALLFSDAFMARLARKLAVCPTLRYPPSPQTLSPTPHPQWSPTTTLPRLAFFDAPGRSLSPFPRTRLSRMLCRAPETVSHARAVTRARACSYTRTRVLARTDRLTSAARTRPPTIHAQAFTHRLAHSTRRAVATLREFPGGLPGFRLRPGEAAAHGDAGSGGAAGDEAGGEGGGSVGLEMSWAQGRGTRAYVYTREI
jgi:hypothetical protein